MWKKYIQRYEKDMNQKFSFFVQYISVHLPFGGRKCHLSNTGCSFDAVLYKIYSKLYILWRPIFKIK